MTRRRQLLGFSQHDLAITAGIAPSTIQKLEQGKVPNEGSNMGIDVCMRIALALQVNVSELLLYPTGNRYQRAVQFAKAQHDPAQTPRLHDKGGSIRAQGYRRITGEDAARDLGPLMAPEEDDANTMDDTGGAGVPLPEVVPNAFPSFQRDPSAE